MYSVQCDIAVRRSYRCNQRGQKTDASACSYSLLNVWIDADAASSSQSSQCSTGVALRLEELVETLQDRRKRADQAVKLQLQQANSIKKEQESSQAGSEVRDKYSEHVYIKTVHLASKVCSFIDFQFFFIQQLYLNILCEQDNHYAHASVLLLHPQCAEPTKIH